MPGWRLRMPAAFLTCARPGAGHVARAGHVERRRRLELRLPVTTVPARTTGTSAGRPPLPAGARPASGWAFAGVAVTSFGGPLALAAATAYAAYGLWATIQHSAS